MKTMENLTAILDVLRLPAMLEEGLQSVHTYVQYVQKRGVGAMVYELTMQRFMVLALIREHERFH